MEFVNESSNSELSDNNLPELNHPFNVYHNAFISGYNEYLLYRLEVARLFKFLGEFNYKIENSIIF